MNILTVNLLFSTLVFWLAARLYLLPKLPECEPRMILLPILLLHSTRHLGLMFLAPDAVYVGIPQHFTYPAALGGLLAAVLALIAIPAVVGRIWLFNIEGTLDLLPLSLATSRRSALHGPGVMASCTMGAGLLITQYVTFVVLFQKWPTEHNGRQTAPLQ